MSASIDKLVHSVKRAQALVEVWEHKQVKHKIENEKTEMIEAQRRFKIE
jgi:hypothetical protein